MSKKVKKTVVRKNVVSVLLENGAGMLIEGDGNDLIHGVIFSIII